MHSPTAHIDVALVARTSSTAEARTHAAAVCV